MDEYDTGHVDVVVVGGGCAGLVAAHAARERGATVVVIDKAPATWAGGNTFYSGGAFRSVVSGLDAIAHLIDVRGAQAENIILPPYTSEDFLRDMARQSHGHCDPALTATLVSDSAESLDWLQDRGVQWRLLSGGQSYVVDGNRHFWGGLYLGAAGLGKGLVEALTVSAQRAGITIHHEAALTNIARRGDGGISHVECAFNGGLRTIRTSQVIMAAGGFSADPEMRAKYLGPGWDLAHVRGSPYNTGDCLELALRAGAQPTGHWSGCHAVSWDVGAPKDHGDRELTYFHSKHGYPLGIIVNTHGRRFVDEGADIRSFTYARYGREVLRQPGSLAFQLYDSKTRSLLRTDQYEGPGATVTQADSIPTLATKIGIDPDRLTATVREFNAATGSGDFNPARKDGLSTSGLVPPKSNWALPLDNPPYFAFSVTCGISFTYGGVKIDTGARLIGRDGAPIPGLYAAGEIVGGLFFHNYPSGSALTAATVFGRRAGTNAATQALSV